MNTTHSRRSAAALLVGAVYMSTPIFVALDYLYGVSLRIPFLDALPSAKAVYYAIDLGCGIAIFARPRWTAAIGFAESTVNISLLIISTWAAYFGMLDSAGSPDTAMINPFTPQAVTSLILSAAVLGASYTINSYELRAAK